MRSFKLLSVLCLCLLVFSGCKGDISTQALTEFKDYKSYFEGTEGCFVLYQNKLNKYWMYNGFLANDPASPDQTYAIYRNLIEIELGLSDKIDLSVGVNNKAPIVPSDELVAYMEDLNYGNKDVSGPAQNYWTNSSLKITPVQQVEMLRRLYIKVLPFTEQNQVEMKKALFVSRYGNANLYGKMSSDQGKNAWFVGFVEKEETAYFFALRLAGTKGQSGEKAKALAIQILKEEKLLGE